MKTVDKKQYWNRLVKNPLFWTGLVLAASYFFLDSFLIATLGLVILFSVKYHIINDMKKQPEER